MIATLLARSFQRSADLASTFFSLTSNSCCFVAPLSPSQPLTILPILPSPSDNKQTTTRHINSSVGLVVFLFTPSLIQRAVALRPGGSSLGPCSSLSTFSAESWSSPRPRVCPVMVAFEYCCMVCALVTIFYTIPTELYFVSSLHLGWDIASVCPFFSPTADSILASHLTLAVGWVISCRAGFIAGDSAV